MGLLGRAGLLILISMVYMIAAKPAAIVWELITGNYAIGVPTQDGQGTAMFFASLYGAPFPQIGAGYMQGTWGYFGTSGTKLQPTSVASAAGQNFLSAAIVNVLYTGMTVTDLTNPVIPDGTTVTQINSASVVLSNNITGGGVLAGDVIQFSGNGGPCFYIYPGRDSSGWGGGMSFANGCVAGLEFNIAIDGYLNAWNVGPMAVPLASYRGYLPGGNTGAPVFPNGFTIGDFSSDYQGDQRLLDGGPAAPTEVGIFKAMLA